MLDELCSRYFTELYVALSVRQSLKLSWMFADPLCSAIRTQRGKIWLYVYVCYALPLLDNLVVAVLVEFHTYSPEPKNSSGLKLRLHMCCYWTMLAQNKSKHRRSTKHNKQQKAYDLGGCRPLGRLTTRSQAYGILSCVLRACIS